MNPSFCKRLKDPHGDVIGLWVANPNDPNLEALVENFKNSEGLPTGLFEAFKQTQYRTVPNRVDKNGGAFLMFGGAFAPGEQSVLTTDPKMLEVARALDARDHSTPIPSEPDLPQLSHSAAAPCSTKPEEQTPTKGEYLCLHCRATVTPHEKPKRTFMGFPKIICPLCKKESRYPLTSGYTVLYGILLAGNVLFAFYALSHEGYTLNPIGLIILIYVVISLVESTRLKRDIEIIKNTAPGTPLTDFRSYKRMLLAKDDAYASMNDRDLKPGYEEWLAAQQSNKEANCLPNDRDA